MNLQEDRRMITDADIYLMRKGEWYRSYNKMGAHPCVVDGVEGFEFNVWAPDVKAVYVTGEFNNWNPEGTKLELSKTHGIWHGFVAGAKSGQMYKYVIDTDEDERLFKADPYGYWAEVPPGTASKLFDIDGYDWSDNNWLEERKHHNHMSRPLNIYEVHLGSWKRHADGLEGNGTEGEEDAGGSYLTYDELSEELVGYVKQMGYTHIELLPVMEHPFDGSWGYQITGYYAPTSRYGNPHDFMHFIDCCHKENIGVILDWVPGGFCRNEEGLARFNGHKLFEDVEHPNWGTYKFNMAKGEVRSYLISNALYWMDYYHIDGMRMDGVTSMLYLNFGIDDESQKKFNKNGTEEDLDSVAFIQQTNEVVAQYYPDTMMIAEESSAWPLVTYPPSEGGLGFHYKWDMGWMNDTLHYMQTDFPYRDSNHKLLTFSMMYAFNENFVLPLSHDEVVHGKCSLIGRMPGDYWRQFAGMRILAFYQMTHPGAKLNFMGNEIAQFIEWRYYESIEWFLANDFESHKQQQYFVSKLNEFYKETPALWENNYSWDGFKWIDADDSEQSIISFMRIGNSENPEDSTVCSLINFDPQSYEEFRIGVPYLGTYKEVFNTDLREFGGSGYFNVDLVEAQEMPWNNQPYSIVVQVPGLAGISFECVKVKAATHNKITANTNADKSLEKTVKKVSKPKRKTKKKKSSKK